MSDLTIFNQTVDVNDGFKYYNVPSNYPLFKATKTFFDDKKTLSLQQNKLYFFGIKDTTPSYIEDYEDLYGVIFEFKTTKSFNLLALDNRDTMAKLYADAPANIKTILETNYGYFTGIRDSVPGPDDELSRYICSIGKQGYAIFNMETDMGGRFHPEFMICNAADGVELVGQITIAKKAESILREAELKRHAESMKAARIGRLFMRNDEDDDEDVPKMNYNRSPGKRLFMNDDDDDDDSSRKGPNKRLFAGSKKRGKKITRNKGKKRGKTMKRNKGKKSRKTKRIRKH